MSSCLSLRDAILQSQDKQLLERTKSEIRGSLRIDTGALSSQTALPSSPVSDVPSKQVSAMVTDSSVSPSREFPSLSKLKNVSSIRSTSTDAHSSLARNHLPSGDQFSAEITPNQKNRVDTWENDPEPTPSPNIRSLESSSRRSSHSRSHSPSIVNLGRRSVVRKRLAEIQHSSTSDAASPQDSRQYPLHIVPKPISRGRLAGNSEAVLELANSSSLIDVVGLPATSPTEQSPSPVSSGMSPSLDGSEDRLTSPTSAASDPSTLPPRPKSAFRLREEMRARDLVPQRHRRASERSFSLSPSAAASHINSQADEAAGALLDVIDVHAERQLIKTAELGDRLQAVQADVRGVAASMRIAISGREQDTRHLAEIQTTVDDVRTMLTHLDTKQHDTRPPETTIDESNQGQIFQALEEIQAMLKNGTQNSTVDGEAKTVPVAVEQPSASFPDNHNSVLERSDLTDIRQKLDMLVELSAPKSDLVSPYPPLVVRRDAPTVCPNLSVYNQQDIH